jgi:energy-coupling factor transport system ATP-binding protein
MISIKDFSFTYQGRHEPALKNIRLSASPGQFIGVLGAEGSGRTTLFRVLNGSAPAHFPGSWTGTAMVGGLDACENGHAVLGEFTSSIFEDPDSQIVSLTVADEVGFALIQRGMPMAEVHQRVSEALAFTGLAGFEQRSTSSLSGGQKQRLVTATALALRPKLLLTDESASALDPRGARELYSLLSGFSRDHGVSVVAVERDLELLMEYADRILVMEAGRIVLDSKPGDMAVNIEILRRAGVRVPVWLSVVAILGEKGILGKLPESEAAAIELLSGMIHGGRA